MYDYYVSELPRTWLWQSLPFLTLRFYNRGEIVKAIAVKSYGYEIEVSFTDFDTDAIEVQHPKLPSRMVDLFGGITADKLLRVRIRGAMISWRADNPPYF